MPSVINFDILNQLRELLGDDFGLILESFYEEAAESINKMESAFDSGDLEEMREAAHSMKSMSGNVGAMGLSELSDQLQTASAHSDQDKVSELWPQIQSQYAAALEELAQIEA